MSASTSLEYVLVLGLFVFVAVQFFLALPWPRAAFAMKPWSCNACLCSWMAIFIFLRMIFSGAQIPAALVPAGAAGGVGMLLCALKEHWTGPAVPPGSL